jgi:hypothetical protein
MVGEKKMFQMGVQKTLPIDNSRHELATKVVFDIVIKIAGVKP